jgi:hypothetical protein
MGNAPEIAKMWANEAKTVRQQGNVENKSDFHAL